MLRSPVFKHFLLYSSGALFLRGVSFFLIPLYTRYLPPAEYGLLDLVTTFSGTLELIFSLGLLQLLQMEYFRLEGEHRDRFIGELLRAYVFISSVLYLISGLILYLYYKEFRLVLVFIAMVVSYLNFFQGLTNVLLRFRERAKAFTMLQIGLGLGSLIMNVIFVVVLRMGIDGILLSNLVTMAVSFLFFLQLFRDSATRPELRFDWQRIRTTLRSSMVFVPGMLAFWGMNSISRWMLLESAGLNEVGYYSIAIRFSSLLDPLLIQPFLNSYNPRILRSFSEGDFRQSFKRLLPVVLGASVIIGPCLSLLAEWLVDPAYQPAIRLIPVLVAGVGFSLIAQTGILLIVYRRKIHLSLSAMVIGFLVSAIANYVLTGRYGAMGAALGTSIGNLVWMSLVLFIRSREVRLSF